MFKFSPKSKATLSTVNPTLQVLFEAALAKSPIDFGIPKTGGLRTAEEQHDLFLGGKSNADGHTVQSYHQTGNAVDVYAYVNGRASWDVNHLTVISEVVKETAKELDIKITWGGDWTTFVDMPHYQI